MNEIERQVRPFLKHVEVRRISGCPCPKDSWAPCGGQYEGRYSSDCSEHRSGGAEEHYPSTCPRPSLR